MLLVSFVFFCFFVVVFFFFFFFNISWLMTSDAFLRSKKIAPMIPPLSIALSHLPGADADFMLFQHRNAHSNNTCC